ncbi:hypothetical protein [Streptomyces sp. NBC_01276]
MYDKLQEHYTKPRPQRTFAAGYDPEDINRVAPVDLGIPGIAPRSAARRE